MNERTWEELLLKDHLNSFEDETEEEKRLIEAEKKLSEQYNQLRENNV